MRKLNLLGVGVCATDCAEACEAIRVSAMTRRPLSVTALPLHGLMAGVLNRQHRQRLNTLDLVVPAEQPVRWGLNLLFGSGLRDRVPGSQLMMEVCAMCARQGLSVALYGDGQAALDIMCHVICDRYPNLRVAAVVASRSGRSDGTEQAAAAQALADSGADVVLVGLACPRQDTWLFENRALLGVPSIGVSSGFTVHAKRTGSTRHSRQQRVPQPSLPGTLWLYFLYLVLLGLQKSGLWDFQEAGEPAGAPHQEYA